MTQEIILNADSRERSGSNKARVIRKIDGMIPAVIYGNNIPGENIKLPLNELTKASENSLFYTQVLIIKIGEKEEKVVLKELQRDPAKGKFLHADFLRVSSKTKLKVTIPIIFINEDECIGVKMEGGVLIKALREIEVLCLAGNIPETIDVDVTNVPLGDAIRVTELDLPEGSEIVGLEDGQDQMVVSVNAPKAAEEEPVEDEGVEGEEGTDGEPTQGDEPSDDAEGSEES
ncbi:50S ribosomal protein L25/general stress protein Ctc [Gammaproteobacteria bacterium]|nr:50S ribosomal protein L25/general stress protein Ctc [Gammaproteobacteria bacterium]